MLINLPSPQQPSRLWQHMHSAAHSGIREWLHGAFVYASPLLDSLTKSAHFIESIEPKKRLISGASLIACPRALQGHAKREGERWHMAPSIGLSVSIALVSLSPLSLSLSYLLVVPVDSLTMAQFVTF